MKYEKEIDLLLREVIYDDVWMNEDDYQQAVELVLKETNMTKEVLSDQLQTGCDNGYSIEQQFHIIKEVFKKYKEAN